MADNLLVANRDATDVRGALITHQWRHSVCGCFDNCGICIIAYCVPCVSFGQTAEVRGKSCCCWGCLYLIPCVNLCAAVSQRGDVRTIRGIPGSCFGDCLCNIFCPCCVLIQERQESEHIQNDLLTALANRSNQAPQVQVVVRQVMPGYPQEMHFPGNQYGGYSSGIPPQPAGFAPQPAGFPPQPAGFPPQPAGIPLQSGYDQPQMPEAAPAYTESHEKNII